MSELKFSGHESFICKQFWLKKGYDFLKNKGDFNADMAVAELGVGKNMVNSIRYWMKAFALTNDKDELLPIAEYIFGENGKDPFIEDLGSVWLLHYLLVKANKASIYNLVFNDFRRQRNEFRRESLLGFLQQLTTEKKANTDNTKTIDSDISVLLRSYLKPKSSEAKGNVEEEFSSLFIDLDLLKLYKYKDLEGKQIESYRIEGHDRKDLPYEIILYTILDNKKYGKTITFKQLEVEPNSPGAVFVLSPEGLYHKLEEIASHYSPTITLTPTAGNLILQINSELEPLTILDDYYKK